MNVTGRQRQVHLMFCEVPTDDPSICGPNRPLIGAVLHELDARAAEDRHPGAGVHWIDVDITGDRGAREQSDVWVAVEADAFHERPEEDTDPVAVFGSGRLGRDWIAARARRGETYRLWRVPLGPVDIERPVWTDETTVRGD
ncbi:hypothetical protein [Brachybacterium sp. FME24]|uniref:hypothetical protein n=1 Tax=Brachybacterium sp. FME24 TaxID=2742605 RepID=UPI001866DA9D|nr:hypothetical protein [Brachybacterium sp. FME24]